MFQHPFTRSALVAEHPDFDDIYIAWSLVTAGETMVINDQVSQRCKQIAEAVESNCHSLRLFHQVTEFHVECWMPFTT